jgi:hypothetical protein
MIDLYYAPTPNGWKISIVIAIHPPVIPGWCASTRPQMRNCASANLEIPGSMLRIAPE